MFHLDISDDEDDISKNQFPTKKIKLNAPANPEIVHSSLGYKSFIAPPLVEYNSIDSYCEKKLGHSLLPSHRVDSPSTSDLNKVKSISSPIVLQSPKLSGENITLASSNVGPPYAFFSIEELSLVKNLNHWSNSKVCPVGRVEFDVTSQQCYVHSVLEKGSWKVLLDTSLLKEIPKLKTEIQIFGSIEVVEELPVLKVHFYRNLGSTDLNLFVSSYRLMQRHVPNFMNLHHCSGTTVMDPVNCELNDTLDCYNLSIVEKCVDSEKGNVEIS